MKTIIIEIPEDKTNKIKKTLNKFKGITFYEEEGDSELIQCKNDILSYNRALKEFEKDKTISIRDYLKLRNLDV